MPKTEITSSTAEMKKQQREHEHFGHTVNITRKSSNNKAVICSRDTSNISVGSNFDNQEALNVEALKNLSKNKKIRNYYL
jgi:hypothetical protein